MFNFVSCFLKVCILTSVENTGPDQTAQPACTQNRSFDRFEPLHGKKLFGPASSDENGQPIQPNRIEPGSEKIAVLSA